MLRDIELTPSVSANSTSGVTLRLCVTYSKNAVLQLVTLNSSRKLGRPVLYHRVLCRETDRSHDADNVSHEFICIAWTDLSLLIISGCRHAC